MNKFFKNVILILPVLFLAFNFTNVKADTIVYDSSIKQDGLHHYNCDIPTNLPFVNSGVHCAEVITIFTYGLDKAIYNVGDTVNASIALIGSSYSHADHSSDSTNIPLHPYLIPQMNWTDSYRMGTQITHNQQPAHTCSSLTFLQPGVSCTTSFTIPINATQQQLAPWVNHGPPYSPSEYITTTVPTSYGIYGVYFSPAIGFGAQDPQFGAAYSFNSSGPVNPGTTPALLYSSFSSTYNIVNPASSTAPKIFVR